MTGSSEPRIAWYDARPTSWPSATRRWRFTDVHGWLID